MTIPIVGSFILLLLSNMIATAPLHPVPHAQDVIPSQTSLFPVFGSDAGEFVGLSLINTSVARNDVAVTWTDSEGTVARTGSLSLPSGSQRVALVREILDLPAELTEGWIRIDSSEAGLLSYMTTGRDGIVDATAPVSRSSTAIILPHIAVATGFMELEHTDTLVSLVNPGSAAANGQIELIGLDGLTVGKLTVSIPAHGSHTLRVSEAFRDVLPPNPVGGRTFHGYMKAISDSGLAAWLQIETPLTRRLLYGCSMDEIVPERLVMVSHFASGSPALYRSELNLINAADAPVTLDMVAQDDRGTGIGQPARRALKPGQAFREDVLSLFGVVSVAVFPPPLLTGYIRIRASGGGTLQVIGDINITSGSDTAAMLYPIGAPSYFSATLPFVINDSAFYTGYAIANPNELLTVQTDITIELFDPEGHPVGPPRHVSLSPTARFVSLIEEKVRSGYLKINSNGPIAVLGSIGSWNSNVITPLPALR
ncbi:MAG: hypothetical protein LAP85_25285 [Acidobacteriia bacterium]|nr:hypothetical protein [Terriglobia bacterium]